MPRNCIYAIAKDFCETKLQMEFYKKKKFLRCLFIYFRKVVDFLEFQNLLAFWIVFKIATISRKPNCSANLIRVKPLLVNG